MISHLLSFLAGFMAHVMVERARYRRMWRNVVREITAEEVATRTAPYPVYGPLGTTEPANVVPLTKADRACVFDLMAAYDDEPLGVG